MSIYKVTTEGDCEGRTTRDLGVWQGDIIDIALGLADQCAYSLTFKEIEINGALQPTRKEVEITMWESDLSNKDLLFYNMRNDTRLKSLNNNGSMWRGKISLATEDEVEEMRLRALMQKLSPEDVALLKKKL